MFRPAIVIGNNLPLSIFGCGSRWCSLVFLLFENIQMGKDLLYHSLLVDETDDTHFTDADQKPKTRVERQLLTEKELREIEKGSYLAALEVTGWRVSGQKGAARLLGINPSTFVSRMKKLGIDRPQSTSPS